MSPTNVWEANYYTADPAALTSYKVNIDDLQVHFTDAAPAVADRNLVTYNGAANKPSFTYNFTSPASGQRLLGVANLWYMLTSKSINKKNYIAPNIIVTHVEMEQGIASGSISFSPSNVNRRYGGSNKYVYNGGGMNKKK